MKRIISLSRGFYTTTAYFSIVFLFYCVNATGQNVLNFDGYPTFLNAVAKSYDSTLILGFSGFNPDDSVNLQNSTIIKYGKGELWKINLKNIYISDIKPAPDSGFVVVGNALLNPMINTDTLLRALIIKFNKCGELMWSKYTENPNLGFFNNLIITDNGTIYTYADFKGKSHYIQGDKHAVIFKFTRGGELGKYIFLSGSGYAALYYFNKSDIFINQNLYIPKKGDTAIQAYSYLFPAIRKLDINLNLISQTVIGYHNNQYSQAGTLFLKNNQLIQCASARYLKDNVVRPFFTPYDQNLNPLSSDFAFDSSSNDNSYANLVNGGVEFGDSIVVLFEVSPVSSPFEEYPSLRLYDKNFKLLKTKNINQEPIWDINGIWKISENNFVLSVTTSFYGTPLLYLFDRHLNPVRWPTKAPALGYDYACTDSVPRYRTLDILKLNPTPVSFVVDTARPNWDWVWYASIPEPPIKEVQNNGWLAWPQPLKNNDILYLKNSEAVFSKGTFLLKAEFYDMQGRKCLQTTATAITTDTWVINDVHLPKQGLYLLKLTDKYGQSYGLKITVQL